MAETRFEFTDQARPLVQLGLGDTRIPQLAASSWDTARWEDYISADARWAGSEPFWLDVSCYTHEVEFVSGRERFTDRWQPGTATVTFKNSDGWADLAGTPGAIASLSLRPGRALRIGVELATLGVVWLWRGVVDSTTPDYDPGEGDIVTVNAIDVLGDVGSTKLAEAAPNGADDLVHVRLGRILDAAKSDPKKRILDVGTTKMIPTTLGAQSIDLLGVTADSAGGVVFSDRDGNIVYRDIGWQEYPETTLVDDGDGGFILIPTPPDGAIGNIDKGTPGVAAVINPAYLHAPGPPRTDVSTPDAPSLKLPNSFTIFTTTRQPMGAATGSVCLVGQMDGTMREWIVVRNLDNGDWGFGTSLDGVNMTSNIIPPFAINGVTPIGGGIERFALSVRLDDGVGTTVPALVPSVGTVSTPDTADLTITDTLYVFALVRCDDIDAAGTHTLAGQTVTTGTTMSWSLQINAGAMQFRISSNGTSFLTYTVASAPQLAAVLLDGQDQYIGASIDFSTGVAGQARTALLVSTTGIVWTEANAYTVSGASGLPFNSPDPLRVGARSDGTSLWNGRIYWAKGYHDGTDANSLRWVFDGTEHDSFDEDLTYTDPRDREWTLSTATAIDHLAAMRTTTLQVYVPSASFGGPKWLPVTAAQRIPSLLHTDRASPVRVGGYMNGGVLQQPWNGDIVDVTLYDGDPNLPGQIIWKMSADEHTTGTSWTDPRGRVWTVTGSAANIIDPPDVPGVPAKPGDICPTDWETSFDRAEIATQVILNRELPETIPVLRWNLGGSTTPPPGSTFLDMNSGDQKAATILRANATATGGVNAEPYLRNLSLDSVVRLTDVGDVTNNSRTYRVTGPAVRQTGATGVYYDIPVVWTDGETGIGGLIEMSMTIAPLAPAVTNDIPGQTLYGVEAYELTDLISIDSALFPTLASRVLATRGYTSMPRIEAVTLAAESGDWATMEMMATCRPELPSRYRCRLDKGGRVVFDKEMFATSIRHVMSANSWTVRIALDDAAWAAV